MMANRRALRLACMLVSLIVGSAAQAQFPLTPGPGGGVPPTGGGLQIGTGLHLPAAPIFLGGTMTNTAGPANWPVLDVGPAAGATVMQEPSGVPGVPKMVIPAGVLSFAANGVVANVAVWNTNPKVLQVGTDNNFLWPAAVATFQPGGGPAPAYPGIANFGTPNGGTISYSRQSAARNAFGGAAIFDGSVGPNAGNFRIPDNGAKQPAASLWLNLPGGPPAGVMSVILAGASIDMGVPAVGRAVASPVATSMFGPLPATGKRRGNVNLSMATMPLVCTMFCVGPNGTINGSSYVTGAAISNGASISRGFPWTTGFITVADNAAAGKAELFYLSGADNRNAVNGKGNISLVAGALSKRALTQGNANRGWVSLNLPEPSVALGAAGALAMLALCHGLVGRRSR